MDKNFEITMRKGFHMTFSNGYTASVQWGAGNYCDNYHSKDFMGVADAKSDTAEVAVILGDRMVDANPFVPEDAQCCDTVCGFLTPEQVAEFCTMCLKHIDGR